MRSALALRTWAAGLDRRDGHVFSGTRSSVHTAKETGQHFFDQAPTRLMVSNGDEVGRGQPIALERDDRLTGVSTPLN